MTGTELPDLRDLRFAAEISDALAGSLELRRTLARIVELAVPALGEWAAVTRREGDRLRQVSVGTGGGTDDHATPLGRLPDDERKLLETMLLGEGVSMHEGRPAWLRMLGAADPMVDALCATRADGSPLELAAVPLRAHGHPVGVLCVVGRGPLDRSGLEALARRGAVAVAAAEAYEERSLLASALRTALLPAPLPMEEGLRLGASYRSAQEATEIGGDFYEVRTEPGGWSATVGDVCGKGVGAAVLTGQVRQSLRTVGLVTDDPVRRLEMLNETMRVTDGTSFVTLVHAVLRPGDGALSVRLASGGHPPPMLRRRSGGIEEIDAAGPIVGMLADVEFRPAEFRLGPGETLLCFTDGVPEARGPSGFFGSSRVAALLADSAGLTAQAICDRILQAALEHLDGRPHDDIAILAVQVEGAQ